MVKNILVLWWVCLLSLNVLAETEKERLQRITNQSIELYNRQQYAEAGALLDSIKNSRGQYVRWYYYYGLNQMRLGNNERAQTSLEIFVRRSPLTETARAYYYIGLIQFNEGEYEKAINSLQLSLDTSSDPQLDNMSEALIDRAVRYQSYYENSKRANLTFLVGYTYDSNVINFSPDLFPEKLSGHVLNYGGSFAYKAVDKYNFVFEPTLAVLDAYTLDDSFKANSTVQSTDALQVLVSLPVKLYTDEGLLSNRYEFSLNAYNVYLPLTSTKRELSVSSFFLRAQVLIPVTARYTMRYNAVLAVDKSHGFSSEDDDASGPRYELLATLVQYTSDSGLNNIFYDLGAEMSGAEGINARYRRYVAGLGYMYGSFWDTTSAVRLGYSYLEYPNKATPRRDNQVNFSYNINKDLSAGSAVGVTLGAVSNSSDTELNKYSDYSVGLLYTKNFGF